jgi:NADH-quinone oxidoreductase subunit N
MMAGTFSVFLLSLAGIPPLAGFFAKYYVFAAAIQAARSDSSATWLYWLVGVGLLTSVFSLYYYAGVIKAMFFAKEPSPYTMEYSVPTVSILVIGLAGVIFFGLYPEPVLRLGADITHSFLVIP